MADALTPDEQICAYLDDVYIVCQPDRVRFLFDLLAEALFRVAGIRLHDGKTRVWNRSGIVPQNVEELGPDVWQPRGITVPENAHWVSGVHHREGREKVG